MSAGIDIPWCHSARSRPIISGNQVLCASPDGIFEDLHVRRPFSARRCHSSPGRARDSAVKLVDDLAGESPVSADYPVGTVVISGDGTGDQAVGSPDVNALEGWT